MVAPTLDELRIEINAALLDFVSQRKAEIGEARLLYEEIERLAGAGGKRLRPAFCYWGYRAAGGAHSGEAVAAAASLELLHTFALVHDDIMDDASTRRGVPTVHAAHDIAIALLVGDLALVLADDMLATSGFTDDAFARAFAAWSRMRREVIAGQFLDTHPGDDFNEERARRVARLKSGRYSVLEPMLVGAALADPSDDVVEVLVACGEPLGEAFQLRDDLLGLYGDPERTGKPVDSDVREGKHNVLFARARSLASPDDSSLLKRWGHPDLSDDEVEELRAIIERSGARASIEELIASLRSEAEGALRSPPLEESSVDALMELLHLAIDRDR